MNSSSYTRQPAQQHSQVDADPDRFIRCYTMQRKLLNLIGAYQRAGLSLVNSYLELNEHVTVLETELKACREDNARLLVENELLGKMEGFQNGNEQESNEASSPINSEHDNAQETVEYIVNENSSHPSVPLPSKERCDDEGQLDILSVRSSSPSSVCSTDARLLKESEFQMSQPNFAAFRAPVTVKLMKPQNYDLLKRPKIKWNVEEEDDMELKRPKIKWNVDEGDDVDDGNDSEEDNMELKRPKMKWNVEEDEDDDEDDDNEAEQEKESGRRVERRLTNSEWEELQSLYNRSVTNAYLASSSTDGGSLGSPGESGTAAVVSSLTDIPCSSLTDVPCCSSSISTTISDLRHKSIIDKELQMMWKKLELDEWEALANATRDLENMMANVSSVPK